MTGEGPTPDAEAGVADLERQVAALLKTVSQLEQALVTSRVIGAAIGILMERRGLTQDDAFGQLVVASQRRNRKLRDVAEHVVLTGELEADRSPAAP